MRTNQEQPRRIEISSNGLTLSALEWPGTAPAIIVQPGITSPAATWAFVVAALQLPNRIIVPDLRGRGRSAAPAEGYSLQDYALDLDAWIKALQLERPILLGHSMGARIIVRFDHDQPGVAGHLVVVDPPLSGPGRPPYPSPLEFYINGLHASQAGQSLETLKAQSPGWDEERLRDRMEWLPTCAEQAIAASHAGFHTEDFHSLWPGSKAPALFVRGQNSPVVTEAACAELQDARPDAVYASVEAAGHMIPWDNLPGFVGIVRKFIDQINKESQT